MKNRYKVLIIILCFAALIALIAVLVGLGFHRIGINEYGYSRNRVFGTIDISNNFFEAGNYLIGIDHDMIRFNSGLLKYELKISCNTIDKSFLTVEVLFLGQFIPSQLSNLIMQYGTKYEEMIKLSIQESVRQTIQKYTLVKLLSERNQIEGQITNSIQKQLEADYAFIKSRHCSLGAVGIDIPNKAVMTQNPTIHQLYANALNQSYQLQKQINFLNVGKQLIEQYQLFHSNLFAFVMQELETITTAIDNTDPLNPVNQYTSLNDRVYAAMYMMSDPITKGMNLDKVYITL